MFDFQQKIEVLRSYESLCYTLCVTLLTEEHAACKTAEQVLIRLFGDPAFWQANELERPPFILRTCTRECFQRKQLNLMLDADVEISSIIS